MYMHHESYHTQTVRFPWHQLRYDMICTMAMVSVNEADDTGQPLIYSLIIYSYY